VFAESKGVFSGSPYDAFLRKNGLPAAPEEGESTTGYSRRLAKLLPHVTQPKFVTPADGTLLLHDQPFVFGELELRGLKIFLREPDSVPLSDAAIAQGGIGNRIACHPAPVFTDFSFHNNGAAQDEYDAIHGPDAFASLTFPDLATRQANFNAYLPATPAHPGALGPFRDVPSLDRPGVTDLGLWNIFANPDLPRPQAPIRRVLCAAGRAGSCTSDALLAQAVARFKTPGLRDLGHSAPYLHTGRADTLGSVLGLYGRFSAMARAGTMRNADPQMAAIALTPDDGTALAAFLAALNEDYQ
jgi:hypothetical protein